MCGYYFEKKKVSYSRWPTGVTQLGSDPHQASAKTTDSLLNP